jgi:hypothetical protein
MSLRKGDREYRRSVSGSVEQQGAEVLFSRLTISYTVHPATNMLGLGIFLFTVSWNPWIHPGNSRTCPCLDFGPWRLEGVCLRNSASLFMILSLSRWQLSVHGLGKIIQGPDISYPPQP